jgi:predicted ATPase
MTELRPLRAYHRKIRQDDLQPDPAQEAALAGLERLYDELAAGRRNAATRSLLGTLISSLAATDNRRPCAASGSGVRSGAASRC